MAGEKELRDDLCTCSRILCMKGLVGLYGHVSAFDPDTNRVYVTPGAGSDRANVQPDDLWVFSKEGEQLEGSGRLAAEWPIHTAIHAARGDALAVAHLHAPYSTLFSIAKREFRPVTLSGAMFGEGLPLFEEQSLVTTVEQGQRLAAVLGTRARGVLMRGHGSAVVGSSCEDLMLSCLTLEDNCLKFYQAAVLGDVRTFSPEECAAIDGNRLRTNRGAGWEYFSRQDERWDRQPETSWHPLE